MRTIGTILKESRNKKRFSKEKLEDVTKIKKSFIEAIENENWEELPEYPVVQGFVQTMADTLNVERKQALALLRRDYPPKNLPVNPRPDVSDKFSWSPKMTFVLGVVVVLLVIASYLVFQYVNFISPPPLDLMKPSEDQVVSETSLMVEGKTDSDAVVKVNNQPVLVDDTGNFSTEIEIFEGTREIVVQAKSRSGKETVVKRKINVELEEGG